MTSFLNKNGPTLTEKLMSLKIHVVYFKENLMLIIFHIKTLAWKSKDFEIISLQLSVKFFCSFEIMTIY